MSTPTVRKHAALRVGTSGYQYKHWRQVFYPKGLPVSRWFEHYARHFDTVELNSTFYRLPEAATFAAWRSQAPRGFCYAVKFSRYGSHLRRLLGPEALLERFFERAAALGRTLGPILVQLPPNWRCDAERLRAFLAAAPRRYRWAVEFRDPRWLCEEVYEVLRRHRAALCLHDMIPDHPAVLTTDWTYIRYHGERYGGCYSPRHLAGQAGRIRGYLADGRDVFAYFNNDAQGYAVANALDLRRLVAEGRAHGW
jgi:uncharacterized protein YecE (DUF72 family)